MNVGRGFVDGGAADREVAIIGHDVQAQRIGVAVAQRVDARQYQRIASYVVVAWLIAQGGQGVIDLLLRAAKDQLVTAVAATADQCGVMCIDAEATAGNGDTSADQVAVDICYRKRYGKTVEPVDAKRAWHAVDRSVAVVGALDADGKGCRA